MGLERLFLESLLLLGGSVAPVLVLLGCYSSSCCSSRRPGI